jgi:hypothetical protein
MTWQQTDARRRIAAAAVAMIHGRHSYIEGARCIAGIRFEAGMENDPDILPFVLIDSETDELPIGSVRKLWKLAALKALQPEIDKRKLGPRKMGGSTTSASYNG